MKNLLILIVAIAVYLHFYPQPEVTAFYNKHMASVKEAFNEFSDTKVRLRPEKIFDELKPEFVTFSEREITHLKQITSSRKAIKEFYFTYCSKPERDQIFHIANENKTCDVIGKYRALF
ncbi:hypothetical protein [Litorilituus lipolyticus]|uniref:Uncharacterized protein n=1 Tax=Litorilituus lipolyticus TaxID=2491017 RepID=A0A502L1E3_9GAMM|nr:hypothetical protein [Litorilituus lipolyticus]TPH17718.1 hypothetical protein EPA86_03985 [Litorilituus lipolyticus]